MTNDQRLATDMTHFTTASTMSVTCPKCSAKIPLSEALTEEAELHVRARMEAEMRRRLEEAELEAATKTAEAVTKAEKRAKNALALQLADMDAQLREKTAGLEAARVVELELRQRQRALEEKEKGLALEVARRVDSECKRVEEQATARVSEEYRLKESQSAEQLAQMKRTIDDLKRKAEQGSMQTQGEALEVELHETLRQAFPTDDIVRVPKGTLGADITHTVRTNDFKDCAAILWETKNAKNWQPKWLEKIRGDQADAHADLAVIVSNTIPAGMRHFGQLEGVWVCDVASAPILAAALRAQLHAVQRERVTSQGRSTKESQLYDYVIGNEFHQGVARLATMILQLKADVGRERAAAVKHFKKREKQLVSMVGFVAELFGGVQGIVGASLPVVEVLELPAGDDEWADDEEEQKLLPSRRARLPRT